MNIDLKGKKVIVTGGTRELGYGLAGGLGRAGAELVIIGSSEKVHESARQLTADCGIPVHGIQGNLEDISSIPQVYAAALEKLDHQVDVLVNCAGVQYRCRAEEFPMEQWERILSVNLSAVFRLSQLAAKDMIAQGKGKIINIASMTSFFGSEMISAYTASKGGIAQLTKALSNEWASKGITVNAIAPGYVITKLTADMKEKSPENYREITNRIPMKRWGTPEDLEGIAVFLASGYADYISGAVIPVDGGYLGK